MFILALQNGRIAIVCCIKERGFYDEKRFDIWYSYIFDCSVNLCDCLCK